MREYYYDSDEDRAAQNRFTAYLLVAIKNTKLLYSMKNEGIRKHEQQIEIKDYVDYFMYEPDMLETLSVIEQLENAKLQDILTRIKERDLYIFMQKVLYGRPLREIAEELGLQPNTATTAYHRVVRRIRKELGGELDEF